jgi:DNA-binding HxlR family transcriptional regulator
MSDTPRTDAESFLPHDSKYRVCDADFARQLERELNAANEMFRKLNIHALNLTDRIRRLEEAGDLMVQHFYTDEPRSEMWEKAKEAKL